MSRAEFPASPAQDIDARRNFRGPTVGDGILTPELAEFCQSGVFVVLASAVPPNRPVLAQGLGVRVFMNGLVRVLVWRAAAAPVIDALTAGGGIAATFSRPRTHRSIQLKADSATVAVADAEDRAQALAQSRAFGDDLVSVGYLPEFAATYIRFVPDEVAAIDFLPTSAFAQTPGPGAGAAIKPA
ncbi:MAG: hypothetical protein KDA73_04900 [Rhodobacteraceae bacterium]|nr:hypothetical protein [Paracoccaceae bacterium]